MNKSLSTQSDLEHLLEHASPTWVFDTSEHKIWWANAGGLEFWQAASVAELRDRDFSSDSSAVRERLDLISEMLGDTGRLQENWTVYPKGLPRDVMIAFQPFRIENERSGLLVELIEVNATQTDDMTRRMADATRVVSSLITTMSVDGRVLAQNPAALACYGPPLPSDSTHTDLAARIHSKRTVLDIHDAIRDNTTLRLKEKVRTKTGPRIHHLSVRRGRDPITAEPIILLSEEDVSELSALFTVQRSRTAALEDIVATRSEQLLETRQRIERALQVAAIWDWDIETDRLFFSPNFTRLLGYEPEEYKAKMRVDGFEGMVHPEDFTAYQPVLADFLANPEKPVSYEMRFRTKAGGYLWIQIEGRCFCDDTGKPVRTTGLLTNITERKEIEAQLLTSQRLEAIGQLTGGVAHDFNNLLTVIQGNVQLLDELADLDPEIVEDIENAVKRGADLTRYLLAFARKQSLIPDVIDMTALITNMRTTFLRVLSESIEVVFETDETLWSVFADASQTETAILNLALNARDAMPTGGTLTITCKNLPLAEVKGGSYVNLTPGDYVQITVADTGTGMSAKNATKAFEPFFTTKDVGKGSGLGLSMVLGFSQQSGGDTRITSKKGIGTTVTVYLPKASVQKVIASAAVKTPDTDLGKHVHILEDDAQVRSTLCKIASALGYQISASGDVESALKIAEKDESIAVFLIDVLLPGKKSGVDFAHELKTLRPDAKLILMSGYPQSQLLRPITEALEFQFLHKPFNRTTIETALKAALGI